MTCCLDVYLPFKCNIINCEFDNNNVPRLDGKIQCNINIIYIVVVIILVVIIHVLDAHKT